MARPMRGDAARDRVVVFGAGKLGSALARALRSSGVPTGLRPARRGLPRRIDAGTVVLAVRDRDLAPLAEQMAARGVVRPDAVVLHVAGALDAEPLAPLRAVCAGVAQMHPMISFASRRRAPSLVRGNVHVQGDARAVARARRLARLLGMTPRTIPSLDTVSYHAAAGLVANGAAALAAMGARLLERAGVARDSAPKILGPLLRSVAENVEALGFPEALTGPVRRGDAGGVEKHLVVLRRVLPEAVGFYLESVRAQVPLARSIGDADAERFDAIEHLVDAALRRAVPT